MQILSSYLKLIRIPNLLFIVLVQFCMQEAVISPILQQYGFEPLGLSLPFFLLVAATVLIAAGGYVQNDYFDMKIDMINKPEKRIVGNTVSKQAAMRYYQVLTALGVICGLFLSYWAGSFTLALIFILVPGLLWFYSSNYKRQFMIGNIVVSFATSLSVLIVAVTEMAFLVNEYHDLLFTTPIPKNIYGWVTGFSLFAFVLTWIREIIKDIEDEKGDREMECRTMPIKWGIKKTKTFIYVLIVFTIVALLWVNRAYIHFEDSLTFRYISFGLIIPLIVLIYLIAKARRRIDYHQAATLSKVIMLIGVLYAFIFYYLQAKTFGFPLFGLFIINA